ncbi:MAG: hypothetical protein KAW51_01610 [Candidatus Lokiarchaeota archaeon]|nr:hypothetical protein [Candidatus Lokiarchaeota archaeon]
MLQSIYHEANTQAYINDIDTTYEKVPDTEVNITIEENSRILVSFCSVVTLHIGANFDISMNFFIVLDIEGVENRTLRIHFYDNSGTYLAIRELTHSANMVYQTDTLTAGTYTVSVYWKSEFDAIGDSQLILSSPTGNRTRSLLVQEII